MKAMKKLNLVEEEDSKIENFNHSIQLRRQRENKIRENK